MHRRNFVRLAAGGIITGTAVIPWARPLRSDSARKQPALMKVGTQDVRGDDELRELAALGVNHICGALPSSRLDAQWSVEQLVRRRERVESFGIKLDMLPLPLSDVNISEAENPNILLGQSPERDREIDDLCQMIRNSARAGIPALKYNLTILGVVRTESTPGRGGARYSTFDYERAKRDETLTSAGVVSAGEFWERITYFLKRVIPVAEEYKVRLACHPHDPGLLRNVRLRGVDAVLGNVDGLKRFIEIVPSAYHGLNFCQGAISEMLRKPAAEIFDVIRYFGRRGKIFNVHFRNIRGGLLKFQETFIDDGDVDMLQAMRVYKEVGYDGMIMPDHVPAFPAAENSKQAFAFTCGYIRALIKAIDSES